MIVILVGDWEGGVVAEYLCEVLRHSHWDVTSNDRSQHWLVWFIPVAPTWSIGHP
jgi:hypothetical protein